MPAPQMPAPQMPAPQMPAPQMPAPASREQHEPEQTAPSEDPLVGAAAPSEASLEADWLDRICPYLLSEDGTYRSAEPDWATAAPRRIRPARSRWPSRSASA